MHSNKESFLNFLGIGKKAAYIKEGYNKVEAEIMKKNIVAVFISPSLSENSTKKFINYCEKYNITWLQDDIVYDMGKALNNTNLMVLGICDKKYCERLVALYNKYIEAKKAGGE